MFILLSLLSPLLFIAVCIAIVRAIMIAVRPRRSDLRPYALAFSVQDALSQIWPVLSVVFFGLLLQACNTNIWKGSLSFENIVLILAILSAIFAWYGKVFFLQIFSIVSAALWWLLIVEKYISVRDSYQWMSLVIG
jgi:hypothetical protein